MATMEVGLTENDGFVPCVATEATRSKKVGPIVGSLPRITKPHTTLKSAASQEDLVKSARRDRTGSMYREQPGARLDKVNSARELIFGPTVASSSAAPGETPQEEVKSRRTSQVLGGSDLLRKPGRRAWKSMVSQRNSSSLGDEKLPPVDDTPLTTETITCKLRKGHSSDTVDRSVRPSMTSAAYKYPKSPTPQVLDDTEYNPHRVASDTTLPGPSRGLSRSGVTKETTGIRHLVDIGEEELPEEGRGRKGSLPRGLRRSRTYSMFHGRGPRTPEDTDPDTQGQVVAKDKKGRNVRRQGTVVPPDNLRCQGPVVVADNPSKSRRATAPSLQRSRFYRAGQPLTFFRRSARKIVIVLSWFKRLAKQNPIDAHLKTFLDMAKDMEDCTSMRRIADQTGLSFDPKYFCAKKDVSLGSEVISILTTPSRRRSPDMVQMVMHALQNHKAFVEYPLHMQQKFAKVAWFQKIPGKRLILKQGHIAENFYFILTGAAIVKKITNAGSSDGMTMDAVARMEKGESFGEIALLHQTLRTATVESATNMDVLLITREDFHKIFFNTTDGQEPEHFVFCRKNIEVLKGFPLELCMQTPGTCLFHYFRPGTVVVADSKKNKWIFIVKSGTCQVLKRLTAVKAQRPWCDQKLDLRLKLPRNGTADPGPKIDSRRRDKTDKLRASYMTLFQGDLSSCLSEEPEVSDPPLEDASVKATRTTRFLLRPETCHEKNTRQKTELVEEEGDGEKETKKRKQPPKSAHGPAKSLKIDQPGFSESKLSFLPEIREAHLKPATPPDWASLDEDRVTFADAMTIDAKSLRSFKSFKVKEIPTFPCFVQLRRLRAKDVFGLEEVEFDDDKTYDVPTTSVTLVSNGCEVIMLSRRMFERHATQFTKQHVREKVRPYPSEDTLQHNLQIEVNWNLFRKDTVVDFLQLIQQIREVDDLKIAT